MKKISQQYYNTYQIKMPLEISRIIEISDPVYILYFGVMGFNQLSLIGSYTLILFFLK